MIYARTYFINLFAIAAAFMLLLPNTSYAECSADLSCEELGQCKAFESYRIPFSTIRDCIRRGTPPPKEWVREGKVNRGGIGSVTFGNLESPFFPTATEDNSGSSPSSGIFDDLLAFPSGPSTQNPPDCSTYKSPQLLRGCDLRGERRDLANRPVSTCGASIELDHDWAIVSKNASHAAMTDPETGTLQLYSKNGANLQLQNTVEVPRFYCELVELPPNQQNQNRGRGEADITPRYKAEKIFLKPNVHYAEYSERTEAIPITMRLATNEFGSGFGAQYVVMKRTSMNNFTPPPPNPEYFIAQGAINVDPKCYTLDHLFTDDIPESFGDMLFGEERFNACASEQLKPHRFLPESEQENCIPFVQYVDTYKDSLMLPPKSNLTIGRVSGGNSYSPRSIRIAGGKLEQRAGEEPFYNGPMLVARDRQVYLSAPKSGYNEQIFPGGAHFIINEERFLKVNPPGRVRIYSDKRMRLVGTTGVVEDNRGRILQNFNGTDVYVQFPSRVIEGSAQGSIAPPAGSVLPTNKKAQSLLPYDTRLDLVCERPIKP